MPTGQAVGAQAVGGAGVDALVAGSELLRVQPVGVVALAASGAPSRARPTMRWRGVRVSVRDGQTGSQKPHSMHLSTSRSAAGSGFRFFEVRPADRR